ncbi:hypothetical protein N7G274_003647 [Stereocaulon virgatum]|uniref:NADH:ubiquinone oxidoreductase intermediate-associated protein 30 domain-containing protein n=1 Tax=Stereocaulon virgatum TaxID=373712 RepID=A0ABR4AES1_9LECA
MTAPPSPHMLFGSSKPFLPPPWTTTDDRLRGGSSRSYLTPLSGNCARFHGHLDTSTLGGAGFASQYSPETDGWDLSGYDGIELIFREGDGRIYTLVLRDEESLGKRDDGREKAGINWEAEFRASELVGEEADAKGQSTVWLPWNYFEATYRGKEKKDAGELKTGSVRRVGIMMRSYFDKQSGDFSVVLKSICARKENGEDKGRVAGLLLVEAKSASSDSTKGNPQRSTEEAKKGWVQWLLRL